VAKKRIHEIAKAQGVASKELLAALSAAGIEAKAAASSVEEAEALKALAAAKGDGGAATATRAKPDGKPAAKAQAKAPAQAPEKSAAGAQAKTAGAQAEGKPAAAAQAKTATPAKPSAAAATPDSAKKPATAAKKAAPAARKPAGAKKRRVVIDSQAARRDQMGGPPPQRPPRRRGGRRRRPLLEEPPARAEAPAELEATKVNSGVTVREVAEVLGLGSAEVIKKLMTMGEMATLTQTLSDDSVRAIAEEYDRKIEIVTAAEEEPETPGFEDAEESLAARPPVVTIMGHVDHGKTSLLDAIRETEVAAGEAGGITQHIGAYQVHHAERTITFLDTPGHAAFTAMRARGARVTDIAVVVVAADDGVMPQTKEAIDHARAADVPILIAVNKIDKEGAQPDRVRNELAADGLTPEDWGGETVYCDVSAKTHEGLDNLLDMILLVSELEELGANPDAPASGTVIESQLDPGRGPVVSILVQRGTLQVGDALVAGSQWGRVRAMHDFTRERVERALPGTPVEVLGFDGVCEAGEFVQTVENDRRARQLAQERANRLKTEALARRQARKVSLEEVFSRAQEGDIKELNIVLKADVAGSLEALQDEIAKVPQERVGINIIHS
jgi:translation initiation factor IF-2